MRTNESARTFSTTYSASVNYWMAKKKLQLADVRAWADRCDSVLLSTDERLHNSVFVHHQDGSSFLFRNAFAEVVNGDFLAVFTEHHGAHVWMLDDLERYSMFGVTQAAESVKVVHMDFAQFRKTIIGMKRVDAIQAIASFGMEWRIIKTDGKSHVVTRDYHPNRLNLEIKKGKVMDARYG